MNITLARRFGGLAKPAEKRYIGIDEHAQIVLHLDNNVTDSSSDATSISGSVTSFTQDGAKFGYSGVLNGNDYLSFPRKSETIASTDALTLEFWIKPDVTSMTGTTWYWIVSNGATWDSDMGFIMQGNKIGYYDSKGLTLIGTTELTQVWYHIAYVLGADGSVKIYLNGVLEASGARTGTINQIANPRIGRRATDAQSGAGYVGMLDEFRWSNIARYTSNFTPQTTPYVGS